MHFSLTALSRRTMTEEKVFNVHDISRNEFIQRVRHRRRNPVIIKLKNGIDYLLLKREGEYYLLTDQKEKTDSSFEWWRTHYRKKIDPYDECVEECYDMFPFT